MVAGYAIQSTLHGGVFNKHGWPTGYGWVGLSREYVAVAMHTINLPASPERRNTCLPNHPVGLDASTDIDLRKRHKQSADARSTWAMIQGTTTSELWQILAWIFDDQRISYQRPFDPAFGLQGHHTL